MSCCVFSIICFFKQKKVYEMRISDVSSDVCSSDLLRRQYVVTFPSRAEGGSNAAVTLAVGDERATADFVAGSTQSATVEPPKPAASPTGPGFLRSSAGLLVALLLVAAAVGLASYSLAHTSLTKEKTLNAALDPYATYSSPGGRRLLWWRGPAARPRSRRRLGRQRPPDRVA